MLCYIIIKMKIIYNYNFKISIIIVKVAYIRPKYENLKEWCKDPQNIYIGRKVYLYLILKDIQNKVRYGLILLRLEMTAIERLFWKNI